MGNISRTNIPGNNFSGLPRHMEGARYNLQLSGFPEQVYSTKDGLNDYAVGLRRCLIRSGQNRKKGGVVAGGNGSSSAAGCLPSIFILTWRSARLP